jgi:hypothetical protein
LDILSKAEKWSLLYGDKLTASATTRFPTLYKGAVGGLEHVISVDNGGAYFELWREGENWYATTGAAIKELPGLMKGAKLDEALDQFFKLTSKVQKAVVRKHQDTHGPAGHTTNSISAPLRSTKKVDEAANRMLETRRAARRQIDNAIDLPPGFARRTTTYGPSTPSDKPHGGAYNYMKYTNEPDSGVGRHIHKPHGAKTKPYSHSHPAGRVHKAEDTSRRLRKGSIRSQRERSAGRAPHSHRTGRATPAKSGVLPGKEYSHTHKIPESVAMHPVYMPKSHGVSKAARKQDNLTQGGRISGGVTTPEVARTGGAGQPTGYGSTGNPQYNYANKARMSPVYSHGRGPDKPHSHGKRTHAHWPGKHTGSGTVKKAVAQVGPSLKIGHKTPSNVSGGNVNPMENKGKGSALPQRSGVPSGPHTHDAGYGRVSQHTHPVAGPHEHREPTEYTQNRRENKGAPFYSGSRTHGGLGRNGKLRHGHTSYKPTVEPRGTMMPHGPTRAYSHVHGKGTHQDISPSEEDTGKSTGFTAKMVRMTIKDLHQLVNAGTKEHDPYQTHGRKGTYHSHSAMPVGLSSGTTHEHTKGFHSKQGGGTSYAWDKGKKHLKDSRTFRQTPEYNWPSGELKNNVSYPNTKTPHGDSFNWHAHPHKGLKSYEHAHDRGSHANDPLSTKFSVKPMKKAGGYDAPPGQETVSSVNPHKGGLHAHPDIGAKTHGQTFSHEHGPSEGHGFGRQYDNDGGWKSPFKRARVKKNIMGLDTPEAPGGDSGLHSHSQKEAHAAPYSHRHPTPHTNNQYSEKHTYGPGGFRSGVDAYTGPRKENNHYEGTPHDHKRTMGGSKTNYGGGDHYGNETPDRAGRSAKETRLLTPKPKRHLQHAKEDDCTACSEVSKAVAAVEKLNA